MLCLFLKRCHNAIMTILCVSVLAHNASATERKVTPINTVLCPGLGTAVGQMPYEKAAFQVSVTNQ